MTDTPQEATGDAAFKQEDIDALLGKGAGGEPPAPDPGESGSIDQADIDALMGAASAGGDSAADADSATQSDAAPADEARVDTLGRPFDDMAAAMQAAIEEENAAKPAPPAPPPSAAPPPTSTVLYPDFTGAVLPPGMTAKRVTMLNDVDLGVKIELGRTRMLVEDVLRLDEGSVVELDKLAGDPVDVFANDRLVARGEVLVLNESFCVRISEVFSHDPHRITE